jgi:hypothetical protein
MAAQYTQAELNTSVSKRVSGDFTAANFLTIANDTVKAVLNDVDLRSQMRKAALSPNLFDEVYRYSAPSDLKGDKIIDIQPQIKRNRHLCWKLVTQEEFDRYKGEERIDKYGDPITINNSEWVGNNLVSIERDDLTNKLLLSRPIDDEEISISSLDSTTAGGGTWTAFGDGENLTQDSDNYIRGSASLNWDIDDSGGTTAGIYNDDVDTFDISDYKSVGSAFVWAYITSTTNLTNYILRIGSDSSNYYYITITTNNEGNSFEAGWNLLRFDFENKSTTGTPDDDACDYVALYMTKDGAKTSETDYRFDNLVLKIGDHYDCKYYSRYGWQNNGGTWIEEATTTTDLLNCESDEYELFLLKNCELMELHLKNWGNAREFRKDYELFLIKYQQQNPSQALPLIQNLWDL